MESVLGFELSLNKNIVTLNRKYSSLCFTSVLQLHIWAKIFFVESSWRDWGCWNPVWTDVKALNCDLQFVCLHGEGLPHTGFHLLFVKSSLWDSVSSTHPLVINMALGYIQSVQLNEKLSGLLHFFKHVMDHMMCKKQLCLVWHS